jgi:hypothetical protein
MAKEEYVMPQSKSDVESGSGEVDKRVSMIMKANMTMKVMMVMTRIP